MLETKSSRLFAGFFVAVAGLSSAFSAEASGRGPQEINCLAEMIYHEARGEGIQGQRAVAEVILNRAKRPDYPSNLCSVVSQPGQFAKKSPIRERSAMARATSVAQEVVSGKVPAVTSGATHFHTPAVNPAWSRKFERTARIERHIFYRQP